MKMNSSKRKNPQTTLDLLSQKELIKRINKSTRNSYKYLDQLIWRGGENGKFK